MKSLDRARARCRIAAAAVALALVANASHAVAEEAFETFLSELRSPERRYYDMALEYLAEMQTSALVPAEVKATIPYEEARTLIDAALIERDAARREAMLSAAHQKLDAFARANPSHRLAATATMDLGRVLVKRGDAAHESASRPGRANDSKALMSEARRLYGEAQKVFDDSVAKLEALSKTFETFIDPSESERLSERDQTTADLVQAKLYAADILLRQAKTYTSGSDDAKKLIKEAADRFEAINRDYRKLFGGLYALLKQGQSYQELGDMRRAIGFYTEVIHQRDQNEQVDRLKHSALHQSLECWTSPAMKEYELAMLKGEEWLKAARGRQADSLDGLGIRFYTAWGAKLYADSLAASEGQKKKQALATAREHAELVAKSDSSYRDRAASLVRELTGVDLAEKEPTNFAEALARGRAAVDAMDLERSAAKNEPAQRVEHERAAAAERAKAIKYLQLAMRLRTDETPIEEVNQARYLMALAHFLGGNHYDAAVLGEFLLDRYPASPSARPAARLALAGYLMSYNSAPVDERQFDRDRMVDMAEAIAARWPGEDEADEAWMIMLDLAVIERDRTRILEYLSKIAKRSPRRAAAELKAGPALWDQYLRATRLDAESKPPQAELDLMAGTARDVLTRAFERAKTAAEANGNVEPASLMAALSLAQILVGSSEPREALAVLENKNAGPLALLEANNATAAGQPAEFARETYKAALRAYVGTQSLDKAEATMDRLEKLAAADGAGAAELTKIYISLGLDLQEQVRQLREANRTAELANVSKGFELFLERIAARQQGNSFSSLNWVASTLAGLAAGYDAASGNAPAQALAYYQKAHAADRRILEQAAGDASFASEDALLAVELRMAKCERRMSQFKAAVDRLEAILKKKPMLLDAQREAALTFQDWGSQNPLYYSLAIFGARQAVDARGQKVNTIWGWAKLANIVVSDKRYANEFYEARYNVALCRYLQAMSQADSAKSESLGRAQYEIEYTSRLWPELGGEAWRHKYNDLLRKIQQAAGKQPTGLPVGS